MKITVEFVGGCMDGQKRAGDTSRPFDGREMNLAVALYEATKQGRVGERFVMQPSNAPGSSSPLSPWHASRRPAPHHYEVVGRDAAARSVVLFVHYVSAEAKQPSHGAPVPVADESDPQASPAG